MNQLPAALLAPTHSLHTDSSEEDSRAHVISWNNLDISVENKDLHHCDGIMNFKMIKNH
jgi:hypothetical protein